MEMPLMVAEDSFAESRCCTLVMFTRLAVTTADTIRFSRMALTPMSASSQLYRIMTTR